MAVAAVAGLVGAAGAAAAGITIFGLAATTFAGFAAAFALGAGMSIVSRALMPKPSLASAMQGMTSTVREPASSRKIVYGRARVGGSLIFIANSGSKNEYLHMVIVLAGHQIDGYEEIYFNDKKIWQSGTGYLSDWADYVRINRYDGTQTTADSDLVNESVYWTTDHKVLGSAYIAVRLKWDADKFPQGIPNISCVVRGKKVYDPRTTLTAWSQNPALCIRDYITDTRYGLGEPSAKIDSTTLNATANLCEQLVTIDGGNQFRFSLDGVIDTSSSIKENIESMLASMGGRIVFSGGKYFITGSAYVTPTIDIDESVIVGDIQVQTKQSRRSLYNGVKGVFLSEEKNYTLADYPAQISSSYALDDGDPVYLDMTLPFVTNNVRAQRLAKIALLKSRQQTTCTVPVNLAGLKFKAGDFITVSNAKMGWDEKPFEVVDYSLQITSEGAIVVNLNLIETAPEVYDWNSSEQIDFFTEGELDLDDGLTVAAPTNVTVTETTSLGSDGSVIPSLLVTWDASTSLVNYYVVEWKKSTDTAYQSAQTSSLQYIISPIEVGADYDVRVKAINYIGVSSNWINVVDQATNGDTTAPDAPTNFIANGGFKQITLSWVNPPQTDFKHVEIQYDNGGTWADLAVSSGESFVDFINLFGEERTYRLRSVDFSGNKSDYTTSFSGETEFVDTDAFTDSVNQLFEDAGLYGIQPVSSLPAAGDFEGQVVYYTVDNKLYRWTGSAWTKAVATSDLSGTITTTQISDGAITTPKMTANSINADRILANTITGGLLATSGIITDTAQINNGVITNANISNLAVSRAKIQDLAVDTLKIDDNAVTLPRFVSGLTGFNTNSTSFYTIATMSNVPRTGQPAHIRAGAMFSPSTGTSTPPSQYIQFDMRIYAGSNLVVGVAAALVYGLNTPSIILEEDHVTSATTTYTLQVRVVGGTAAYLRILNSFISLVEMKK